MMIGRLRGFISYANARFVIAGAVAAFTVAWSCSSALATPYTFATANMNAVPASGLADGESFTLQDPHNPPTTFEFDLSSSGVTQSHVPIAFSGGDSGTTIRNRIITAINGAPNLAITAFSATPTMLKLSQDYSGPEGNLPITWSVGNQQFWATDFSGGSDSVPELAPIGDKAVSEGESLQFTISASDVYGGAVYSASNLPAGASFDAATRTFSWAPTFTQAGSYADVHFEVSDERIIDPEDVPKIATDSEDMTIFVANVPQPTTTTLSETAKARKIAATGSVEPSQGGKELYVKLYRKRHGKFRLLLIRQAILDDESQYRTAFRRPGSGSCRIEADFPGNTQAEASSAATEFRC